MSARWQRLRAVFAEASELPGEERRAFVERACADDPALKDEVLSLLRAATESDGFLEPRALAAGLGAGTLAAGERVGPYRIERVIAAGGMGVVYEASQESPRRRVALKMLRPGLGGESAARRFQFEAEILAGLRHPGIATVHQTGVHDGAPWFAMELVEGARSIVDHAEHARLDLRARVELFRTVCDAVHHGHLRGVIHRDLKPDNLLVGADGRARVIDFGIARADELDPAQGALRTAEGAILGTLLTMSPEQVAGDRAALDLRTDVYSLGVVLYRLLAGRWPHDVARLPLPEAARVIREDPPPRPGALDPRLSGDLETILLKALEKDPERRYASAAALAEDLSRWLGDEPILARPASLAYQARMFARRHRALVAGAVAVVVVSVAGAAVSLRFALSERRAAEREARAAHAARLAASLAERRADIVRGVGRELLEDVLDALEGLPGASAARASAAATATRYLDALSTDALGPEERAALEPDAALLRDLVHGYARLGAFQADPDRPSLGDLQGALASYTRALEIARVLDERGGHDAASRARVAEALRARGRCLRRAGSAGGGLADLERALALARRHALPQEEARALFALGEAARESGDAELARARLEAARERFRALGLDAAEAVALGALGDLALEAQDFERARRMLGARRDALAALHAAAPGDARVGIDLAEALGDLALCEERAGDGEASLAQVLEGLLVLEPLVDADPSDALARATYAGLLDLRGAALERIGEREAALATWESCAALFGRNAALDPSDLEARERAAEASAKRVGCLVDLGRAAEAVREGEEAVLELEAVLALDPEAGRERALCLALDVLGRALVETDRLERAEPVLARFAAVAALYADRARDDAFAQRQVLLARDRLGMLHQRRAEDETLAPAERAASLHLAAQAYRDCLATFDVLRERGFLDPTDEAAAAAVLDEITRCETRATELLATR